MTRLEFRREGRLFVVTGASRSGKSLWTAQQVARARRLLVWDLLGEWSSRYRCTRVSSIPELIEAARAKAGRFAYYRPGMAAVQYRKREGRTERFTDFDTFCRIAWVWLRLAPGALVVEETASVTSPGKAPAEWGDIVRMGLRYGTMIYALTQRPAESDKTAFGNASVVHAGRAVTPSDRATVAEYLDVPVADVAALQPLQFIERHAGGELVRGRVDPRKAT